MIGNRRRYVMHIEKKFNIGDKVFVCQNNSRKVLKRKGASKTIALAIAEFEDRKKV